MIKAESIKCDVLVAGGGSAGLAAAVAASRKGASVVLLEKNGFMGGKASAAYVSTICGLYYRSENPVAQYVADGFMVEFAEKLKFRSNTTPIHNKHGLHFLPYKPFDFKILCDHYIQEEKINVYFHSTLSGVEMDKDRIHSVDVVSYDRKITFFPQSVIDCTGEALISLLAGANTIESDEYQAPAQVFALEGVNSSSENNLGFIMMKEIQKAINDGYLSHDYVNVSIVHGSLRENQVYLKIGIPIIIRNEVNKITQVEITARKMVLHLVEFLTKTISEFKNARISDIAPEVGVRTSRRNKGREVLMRDTVVNCLKNETAIARGAWPIEFWDLGKRVKMDFFKMDDYYDISKDCLVSESISNLFFAGRNISATEEGIASARVIGTCLQTGFSAGEMAC